MEIATRDEIGSIFAPAIIKDFSVTDSCWDSLSNEVRKRARKLRVRRLLLGWLMSRYRRTQRGLARAYSVQWTTPLEQQLSNSSKPEYFEWGSRRMLAHHHGIKRLYNFLLMRAISQLNPQTVLEVGFGNGINLFLLAGRFPNIRFSGVELSTGGYTAALTTQALAEIPRVLQEFSPEPLLDLKAHKQIEFMQGNAAELPFKDKAFDLVFTTIALEKMEQIRHKALSEASRVARKHLVMIEPFRDFNATGMRRDRILSKDYFAAWISDLPQYGLHAIHVLNDIPVKIGYGVGLVIAEVN